MTPKKELDQSVRWTIGLAAAVLLGALAGYVLSGSETETEQPAEAPRIAPPPAAPEASAEAPPEPAEGPVPILARKNYVPAKPPPPRADLGFTRAAPGDEPEIQGDAKTRMREMQRRLDEWTALMAGTRADIRQQLLEGKKQERERLIKQIDEVDEALMLTPGDDEALEARRRMNDELHYLEDSIERLEDLQENEP